MQWAMLRNALFKVKVKMCGTCLQHCKRGTRCNAQLLLCTVLENCCMGLSFCDWVIYTLITAIVCKYCRSKLLKPPPLCIVSLGNAPLPYITTTQLNYISYISLQTDTYLYTNSTCRTSVIQYHMGNLIPVDQYVWHKMISTKTMTLNIFFGSYNFVTLVFMA